MSQKYDKLLLNESRYQPRPIAVDDLVLIRITSLPARGTGLKLTPKWQGSFRVSKIIGNDRYEVVEVKGSKRCSCGKHKTVDPLKLGVMW